MKNQAAPDAVTPSLSCERTSGVVPPAVTTYQLLEPRCSKESALYLALAQEIEFFKGMISGSLLIAQKDRSGPRPTGGS